MINFQLSHRFHTTILRSRQGTRLRLHTRTRPGPGCRRHHSDTGRPNSHGLKQDTNSEWCFLSILIHVFFHCLLRLVQEKGKGSSPKLTTSSHSCESISNCVSRYLKLTFGFCLIVQIEWHLEATWLIIWPEQTFVPLKNKRQTNLRTKEFMFSRETQRMLCSAIMSWVQYSKLRCVGLWNFFRAVIVQEVKI